MGEKIFKIPPPPKKRLKNRFLGPKKGKKYQKNQKFDKSSEPVVLDRHRDACNGAK